MPGTAGPGPCAAARTYSGMQRRKRKSSPNSATNAARDAWLTNTMPGRVALSLA